MTRTKKAIAIALFLLAVVLCTHIVDRFTLYERPILGNINSESVDELAITFHGEHRGRFFDVDGRLILPDDIFYDMILDCLDGVMARPAKKRDLPEASLTFAITLENGRTHTVGLVIEPGVKALCGENYLLIDGKLYRIRNSMLFADLRDAGFASLH